LTPSTAERTNPHVENNPKNASSALDNRIRHRQTPVALVPGQRHATEASQPVEGRETQLGVPLGSRRSAKLGNRIGGELGESCGIGSKLSDLIRRD
jgi:hypothetical protein